MLRAGAGNEAGETDRESGLKGSVMTQPLLILGRPRRSTAMALLQSQGLPVSDITDEHLQHFFFVGSESSPTGLVGVEIYGADALLRSLVVGEAARDKGLGSVLVNHAERYAASQGVHSIYLLTTTAEAFFKRLGYERIDRSRAPPSIKETLEFASVCPASSAFMTKAL
jgi:amino-acid N-acetyltransferase